MRPRVRWDVTSPEKAVSHLTALTRRLEAQVRWAMGGETRWQEPDRPPLPLSLSLPSQDAELRSLSRELTRVRGSNSESEARVQGLLRQMSAAATSGDLRYIGVGTVGPHGARIMPASLGTAAGGSSGAGATGGSSLPGQAAAAGGARPTIRGGGGGSAAVGVGPSSLPRQPSMGSVITSPPQQAAGGGGGLTSSGSFINRFWRRLSSPLKPAAQAAAAQQQPGPPPLPMGNGSGVQPPPFHGAGDADLTAAAERAASAAAHAAAVSAALFKAAEDGDDGAIETAIAAGGHVNCEDKIGRTPLLYAARGGRLRVCQHLVRLGADVLSSDRDGRNALHYSARRGHVDVARWFIAQVRGGGRGRKWRCCCRSPVTSS